jgi:2-keto-4-pentenoate hydratase/2-oxohepta-3-ene-1,7-dioic acid hydratase in catechol pathway
MQLARFRRPDGQSQFGMLDGTTIRPIEGNIFSQWQVTEAGIPLASVALLAPVEPVNLLCLGKNHRAFPGEQNPKFPPEPLLFIKATTAVIGPEDHIQLPAMAPREVYFEAELAAVIGRQARNVEPANALGYVLGYTVCNDLGAKDAQAKDGQWARAKSSDTFAPLGPWIETDLDPGKLRVRSQLNGRLIQDSNTDLMIFDVPYTISYLSRCMTLQPGTVITMGSPGVLQEPRPFLQAGNVMEAEVEGIGTLRNRVKTAQGR